MAVLCATPPVTIQEHFAHAVFPLAESGNLKWTRRSVQKEPSQTATNRGRRSIGSPLKRCGEGFDLARRYRHQRAKPNRLLPDIGETRSKVCEYALFSCTTSRRGCAEVRSAKMSQLNDVSDISGLERTVRLARNPLLSRATDRFLRQQTHLI